MDKPPSVTHVELLREARDLLFYAASISMQWGDKRDDLCARLDAALAENASPVAEQPPIRVCCGQFSTCERPCTPRGRWLAEQDTPPPDEALLRRSNLMLKFPAMDEDEKPMLALIRDLRDAYVKSKGGVE